MPISVVANVRLPMWRHNQLLWTKPVKGFQLTGCSGSSVTYFFYLLLLNQTTLRKGKAPYHPWEQEKKLHFCNFQELHQETMQTSISKLVQSRLSAKVCSLFSTPALSAAPTVYGILTQIQILSIFSRPGFKITEIKSHLEHWRVSQELKIFEVRNSVLFNWGPFTLALSTALTTL